MARIIGYILRNDKSVIPLSVHLAGEHDVSMGVSCLIGHECIEHVFDLELRDKDQARLHNFCEIPRESPSQIK